MRLSGAILCGALAALGLGVPAMAQDSPPPAPTASAATPVAPAAATASQNDAIDAWIRSASTDPAPALGLEDPVEVPRRIHGEVGAAVGSNGYRSFYGDVSVPFGRASSLDVAAADEQWKSKRWGSGERRTLAIGLFLSGGDVVHLFDRWRCNPHPWAVDLKGDPVIEADGSCERSPASAK